MGFRVMCSYVWITVPAFTGWVTLYITQFASLWLSFHISRIETIIIIVYSLLVYIFHRVVMRIKWSKVWEIFQWVPGTWLVYILLTYPHFVVKEAKAERDKKAVTRSHISKHQSLNSNPGLSYSKAHILDLHTRLPPFPTGFAPWRREEGKLVSPQHKCALPLNLFLVSRWSLTVTTSASSGLGMGWVSAKHWATRISVSQVGPTAEIEQPRKLAPKDILIRSINFLF